MSNMTGYFSIPGLIAAADLSTKQYHLVKFNGTGRQVAAITDGNVTTEHIAGILQDDPNTTGDPCDVAAFGVAKAECGGTITAGDFFASNNDGEIISDEANPANQTNANDLYHMGIALEDGVDGDIIDVYIMPLGLQGIEA